MSDDESDHNPDDNPTDLMASAADDLPPSAASVAALVRAAKRPKVSPSGRPPRRSSSGRTRPVVKLLVTSVSRSYNEPWRRRPQRERCVFCWTMILFVHVCIRRAGPGRSIEVWVGGGSKKVKDLLVLPCHPCQKQLVPSMSKATAIVQGTKLLQKPTNQNPQPVLLLAHSSGTGFLIQWSTPSAPPKPSDGIRIVTNAHVVRNASTVRARASFGPHVVSCEVEWLSLPLDLALLKIAGGDWHEFCRGWNFPELDPKVVGEDDKGKTNEDDGDSRAEEGMAAMNIDSEDGKDGEAESAETKKSTEGDGKDNVDGGGRPEEGGGGEGAKTPESATGSKCLTFSAGLPRLDENVTCVGFPQGGSQISVTRGVVSRIDVDSNYVLRIQIDAAINPG